MTLLLTIVATVAVALAITAAPASAQGRVGGKMHLDDVSLGIVTDKALPKVLDDSAGSGWWQRRSSRPRRSSSGRSRDS